MSYRSLDRKCESQTLHIWTNTVEEKSPVPYSEMASMVLEARFGWIEII